MEFSTVTGGYVRFPQNRSYGSPSNGLERESTQLWKITYFFFVKTPIIVFPQKVNMSEDNLN